ncbi:dipeptidyl peptidase 2 [Ambystoma mexicanum]|uniref:dipeptidyl peptidase 2 n=1 Tax=Ambystoma mexicanum TaxID=8296 RepID=UPI0037E938FE
MRTRGPLLPLLLRLLLPVSGFPNTQPIESTTTNVSEMSSRGGDRTATVATAAVLLISRTPGGYEEQPAVVTLMPSPGPGGTTVLEFPSLTPLTRRQSPGWTLSLVPPRSTQRPHATLQPSTPDEEEDYEEEEDEEDQDEEDMIGEEPTARSAVGTGIPFIPHNADPDFQEKYYKQMLDHFSFLDHGSKTFFQRYLITDEYWIKLQGPIFFYAGNEDDIWECAKNSGFVAELAASLGAIVVFAEHRYYGKSLPYGKMSTEIDHIGLLSVEQALGDFVMLIKEIKAEFHAEKCPVIVFGSSYGGLLSAYIRIKYPDVVAGSLASSAPLYSACGSGDRNQFFADVTAVYQRCSPDCTTAIREAFREIKDLYMLQDYATISNKMKTCEALETRENIYHLYEFLRNAITAIAVLNYPYQTDFMGHFPANPVKAACNVIQQNPDHILGLHDLVGIFYNATGQMTCYSIYQEFAKCSDPTGCGTGMSARAWDYQILKQQATSYFLMEN